MNIKNPKKFKTATEVNRYNKFLLRLDNSQNNTHHNNKKVINKTIENDVKGNKTKLREEIKNIRSSFNNCYKSNCFTGILPLESVLLSIDSNDPNL